MTPAVLNLVINGIPSILWQVGGLVKKIQSFKPCYKWNTFNTIVVVQQVILVH